MKIVLTLVLVYATNAEDEQKLSWKDDDGLEVLQSFLFSFIMVVFLKFLFLCRLI